MNWIKKIFKKNKIKKNFKTNIPKGIWTKCNNCKQILYKAELDKNLYVCPKCDYHGYISARKRLDSFLDKNSGKELGKNLKPYDILNFHDLKRYKDRIISAQKKTGEKDSIIVMKGKLMDMKVISACFDFSFMGGSMGSVVGARFICGVEEALKNKCPFICFSCGGGARMQEGFFSLMQMAKTSAALGKMKKNKIPYISVLTNPTMGGISASLAMLGDLNIAEPKALIGFAGPRVIEQTVNEKLPVDFQNSEFLLEKGMIDIIIKRTKMREKLFEITSMLFNKNFTNF